MGYSVDRVRLLATTIGGFLAGVGGAFLSLYYPGSWNEGLSRGQGLMAVALVIFARWNPIACVGPRCCSAPPARSGRRCSRSVSPRLLFLQRRALRLTLFIMIVSTVRRNGPSAARPASSSPTSRGTRRMSSSALARPVEAAAFGSTVR